MQWRILNALPIPVILMPVPKNFRLDDLIVLYDDGAGAYGYGLIYRDEKRNRLWVSGKSQRDSKDGFDLNLRGLFDMARLKRSPQPVHFSSNLLGQFSVGPPRDGDPYFGAPDCMSTAVLRFKENRYVIGFCGYRYTVRAVQLGDWIGSAKAFSVKPQGTATNGLSSRQWEMLSGLGIPVILPRYLPDGFRVAEVWATSIPPTLAGGPNYSVTYSNGRSSFKFQSKNGVVGRGADIPLTAFAARYDSKILGSGVIDNYPAKMNNNGSVTKYSTCYGSLPTPYMGTHYYYGISSCDPRVGFSQLARIFSSADVLYQR